MRSKQEEIIGMPNVSLRLEEPQDYFEVENLVREAFWNKYQPGCSEHYLLHLLRDSAGYFPEMHFLAVADGRIIGNIVYSRARVVGDDGKEWPMLTFGPVSVLPEYQRQGIGSTLIHHTVSLAQQKGEKAIILFGDPAYYSRFGFKPSSAYDITLPDGSSIDAFQTLELRPGSLDGFTGKYFEDETFSQLDPDKVDAFDSTFPPREKLRLPGQLR
jgi:predicted N-acetyltransferase YhbS